MVVSIEHAYDNAVQRETVKLFKVQSSNNFQNAYEKSGAAKAAPKRPASDGPVQL